MIVGNIISCKKINLTVGFDSEQESRLTVRFIFSAVVFRPSYGSKPGLPGNDHVVLSAGTVDDLDIAALVPAAHNANMGVLRVEYQIAGLGLGPRDRRTIAVLHPGPSAMANHVAPARHIVKYPIHKAGTVHAIGPVGSRGGTASGPNLLDGPPAGIPAKHQRLAAPKIIHFAHQLAGRLHHGPALRGKVHGQAAQQLGGVLLADAQVSQQRTDSVQLRQKFRQGAVLFGGKKIDRPHFIGGPGGDGDM